MTVEEMLKFLPKHCHVYITNCYYYRNHAVTCWSANILDFKPIHTNIPFSLTGVGMTMHDAVKHAVVALLSNRAEFQAADIIEKEQGFSSW
jgi:hypothetical protein